MEKEKHRRGAKLRIALGVLVLLAVLIYALTGFLTDLLWFRETGYVSVFFTELLTKIKVGIPVVIVVALLMWAFLSALKKAFLSKGGYKLSVLFSVISSAGIISRLWWQILQFLHATEFNVADPLFGNDVGFYVFKLEFLESLSASALSIVGFLLLATVIYYVMLINLVEPDGTAQETEADTYEYDIPGEDSPGRDDPAKKIIDLFTKRGFSREEKPREGKDLKQTGHAILRVAGTQIAMHGRGLRRRLHRHQCDPERLPGLHDPFSGLRGAVRGRPEEAQH